MWSQRSLCTGCSCCWECSICCFCTCCFAAPQGHTVALTSSAPDLFSTYAKNSGTHTSFSVREWKWIHFLPHEICACIHKLPSNMHVTISSYFLGELWNQIWNGIRILLTGGFPLIMMAPGWGSVRKLAYVQTLTNSIGISIVVLPLICSFVWVRRAVTPERKLWKEEKKEKM